MTGDLQAELLALRPRIERYIATMVSTPATAADLSQDSFTKATQKLGDLRDASRLRPWLFTIAINIVRQHLRREVNKEQQIEFDPQSVRGSVLSSIVQRESTELLAIAIERLPILLREAFALHVVECLPFAEIADITGASVEALHVRNHRAKALLRRQIGSTVDTFWSKKTDS